jgi:8-hydroxy-5-deazaflavin:NADPH oxidoreductase
LAARVTSCSGLAKCWLAAGYKVIVGSRSAEKAEAFAEEPHGDVLGDDNAKAATAADIVVLTAPFASHEATLREAKDFVQGKIVVDAAVPLVPPKVSVVQLPS